MPYTLRFEGPTWNFEQPVADGDDATIIDAAGRALPGKVGLAAGTPARLIDRVGSGGTVRLGDCDICFVLRPRDHIT